MKQVVRVEMRRALMGKATKAALIVGTVICIIHLFRNMGPPIQSMEVVDYFLKKGIVYPYHVFDNWICGNTYNLEGFLYFMILPVLAVMPYGDSYYTDLNSGFLINVYARCKRIDYLVAKYIAAFTVGGTVFVVPLLINLAISATLLPSLLPQTITATSSINTSVIWYQIFNSYPYVYVFLYLLIDFIFAGLIACTALTVSFYTEKRIVVLIAPFIMHVFIYSVCSMIREPLAMSCTPTYFLFAGFGCVSGWIFILFGLGYFILGCVWFLGKGRTDDIF